MSTSPSDVQSDAVRDSTYSAGTFGGLKSSTAPTAVVAADVEGLRLSLGSSLAVEPSEHERAASSDSQDVAEDYEQLASPINSSHGGDVRQQGASMDAEVAAARPGAVASEAPSSTAAISPLISQPTLPPARSSSPADFSSSNSTQSDESDHSGSPLMPCSDRTPTPGVSATFAPGVDAAPARALDAVDDKAGARTPMQGTGTEGLSSEALTAMEKAVLMKRARKLEKVLGSTLQEHQVTHSLSHSRSASQSVPSSPPRTARRLSDPTLSPSKLSFLASSSSSASSSPSARRSSLALSVDSAVSGETTSPSRRRRSSISTVNPTSPCSPNASLSDAQRRLRLQKIHRMLGAEVGAEHVFASTPGAGPWLEDGRGSPSPHCGAGELSEGRGGWKGVVGKARNTLGRSAHSRKESNDVTDGAGASGGEEDALRASPDYAGRMGGVKRGAKLNNIFGDFPPTSLYHRSALAIDSSEAVVSADPSTDHTPGLYNQGSRRNSSQSSFSLFDASISQLDHLLRTDQETLVDIVSSIHDANDDDDIDLATPSPSDERADATAAALDPTTALVASLARRRQAARKLAHFFGAPPSALGLFQSTLDTLQEGVREERELGLLGEGEGRGLLGRLGGLRTRTGRELGDS